MLHVDLVNGAPLLTDIENLLFDFDKEIGVLVKIYILGIEHVRDQKTVTLLYRL